MGDELTPAQKGWGIASLIFLCVLMPPLIIGVVIWGIVKMATNKGR